MDFLESLTAEIQALETELSQDTRYRRLLALRGIRKEYEPAPTEGAAGVPDGYKLVPLTKEERARYEARDFLRQNENRVHRRKLMDHLVRKGIMREDQSIEVISVYLTKWDEFESDGKGFVLLRETRPEFTE